MSSWRKALLTCAALAAAAGAALAADAYPGIGRLATPAELRAWDIDVRPDFLGLPPGKGSVARGQDIWEDKCAACHGVFGESNQFFNPLIGGTTADDVKTGRVARLLDPAYPGRTSMMKLATVSTLWDYIHRAMPWNAPKTLSTDEVYAVSAFVLNLGGVVPDDFTLSHENMAQVQARLPNRNGMTLDHFMWPGSGLATGNAPDVRAKACMKDCAPEPKVASTLPDFARNAHGNLADQNRLVGAQRGVVTAPAGAASAPAPAAPSGPTALLSRHQCVTCHAPDRALIGPAWRDIAKRYAGQNEKTAELAQRIRAGGSGRWGAVPMPPQALPADDAAAIAQWLTAGAP